MLVCPVFQVWDMWDIRRICQGTYICYTHVDGLWTDEIYSCFPQYFPFSNSVNISFCLNFIVMNMCVVFLSLEIVLLNSESLHNNVYVVLSSSVSTPLWKWKWLQLIHSWYLHRKKFKLWCSKFFYAPELIIVCFVCCIEAH